MLTKRKIKSIVKILRNTKFDKYLFPFTKNLVLHKLNQFKKYRGKDIPYPTTIMLELTNKCNLKCITCPREYGYGKKMHIGNMDISLAKKIIDESLPYIQSIGLTGMGETLFAPTLVEVAKYIKEHKKSIIIFISTNANSPGFIERIRPVLPYIDTIQVSTDGIGDVYEKVRTGAKFENLVNNIKDLSNLVENVENKVHLMFNMVITDINYIHMPAIIELAHDIGVKYVNFTYFNLASVTDIKEEYYQFFSTDEFRKVLHATNDTAARYSDVEVTGLNFLGNPGIKKCPLMWNHFQINYDGEVPPCCAKPFSAQYSFGNVTSKSLIEVINSRKAKQFRNSWFDNKPNDFCSKCHFVKL